MKIVSSFKHMEHTPALDEKIKEKSEKLTKYLDGNFEVHWTCSVRDDGAQLAEIKLIGPSIDYHATANSDHLYKSLDLVISKIERQIHKKKDKWKKKINHKHNPSFKDQQVDDSQEHERYWEDKENKDDNLAS